MISNFSEIQKRISSVVRWVALAISLGLFSSAFGQIFLEGDLPDIGSAEMISPQATSPGLAEPGLRSRSLPQNPASAEPEYRYQPLYRLNQPYYDSLFRATPPQYLPAPDPSTFRSVIVNEPLIGLHPRAYRMGILEFYPYFGLIQTFDSNVNLTSSNPIADFYLTPRAGIEFQLGSPDSAYTEGYDTVLALQGSYEAYGDLFYRNPEFSAFNQKLALMGRVGRSAAIWRPFFNYSDITGTDLLTRELTNRIRRIRILPGLQAAYKLTSLIGWNQLFSYYDFNHPDPAYINTQTWRTEQQFTYRVLNEWSLAVWGEYRYTTPSRGFAGGEYLFGIGWVGKLDPRLFTQMRIGYGALAMDGNIPRRNLSGLRFNGYTTFQWSERIALTLLYDRDYVFNELYDNDNYVSTLLQLKVEFFLGGNWYLTPYMGASVQEYDLANNLTLQLRPELEVSYALPNQQLPNDPRIFVKLSYMHSQSIQGPGDPVEDVRISTGFNFKF